MKVTMMMMMVIRKVPKRLRLRLSILFEVLTCRDFGDVIVRGVYLSLSLSIEILNSLSLRTRTQGTKESRCGRVQCANAKDTSTKPKPIYDLCAVIEHKGKSLEFGHYTSTVKVCGGGEKEKWYQCNDDRVRLISKELKPNRNAYVLVYRRV